MTEPLTKRELWNRRRKIFASVFAGLMILCLGPWIVYTLSVIFGGLFSLLG